MDLFCWFWVKILVQMKDLFCTFASLIVKADAYGNYNATEDHHS